MNLSFSTITYARLQTLVPIEEQIDDDRFSGWIPEVAEVDESTSRFLADLTTRHRKNIDGYSEEEVKAKLVIPILNRIDFTIGGYTDWYERPISATFGDVTLGGTTDYMIARGEKEPVGPVFFLHEFKPKFTNRSPEVQLVAEMVAATRWSCSAVSLVPALTAGSDCLQPDPPSQTLRGAYLTGPFWQFVLLDATVSKLIYYVSPTLDLFKPSEAARIYAALQALKEDLRRLADDKPSSQTLAATR